MKEQLLLQINSGGICQGNNAHLPWHLDIKDHLAVLGARYQRTGRNYRRG